MIGDLTDAGLADAFARLESILSAFDLLELSRDVKRRAMEAFTVVVRTLDALHVASALPVEQTDDRVALFSHDDGMNRCARAIGLIAPLST